MTSSPHQRPSSLEILTQPQAPLSMTPQELRAAALAGRKPIGSALLSCVLSGLMVAAGAVALAALVFPNPFDAILPPVRLQTTTHEMPSEGEAPSADPERPVFTPPPAPPVRQQRGMVPVHLPVLATAAPASETVPLQQLNQDADVALELLAQLAADEEARQEELLEQERIAEEKRQEQERIAKIEREAADKKRREQEALLAQKRAEESRERARLAAQASEARQRQSAVNKQAQLAKKVTNAPSVTRRTPPRYPPAARKAGVEGTTRIAATVTSDGKVSSPRVVASSGHSSLDSSALAAVKNWRFSPAKNALGQAIAHQVTIPVTFRLN